MLFEYFLEKLLFFCTELTDLLLQPGRKVSIREKNAIF
jgi:hypothetical protein